ncbi:MAG: DNA polymerase I [Dehalococcoidales bacterium]|nr:DNA polymerase I [Dehalococcoidales bacterium]
MEKPRLVLFDGNALIHRAYHALPPLTVSTTGEMVNAVYGFAQMLLKAVRELKPTHYAITFDRKAPTFRHHLFDQYKAHRPPTPAELVSQIGRVKELVAAFRIPTFELDGYEADDLLGTLSCQASQQDIDTVIVTGDTDTMQLVSPRVKVLYPRPGRSFSDTMLYDEAAVSERYGVGPKHIADLKGLEGDPSDNIPGVPSVGPKTAARLIQQFGTVEEIYAHINEVTPPKLQDTLRENKAVARQSKELATIVTGAPVNLNLKDCQANQYDRQQVNELFHELEFTRLRDRLPGLKPEETTPESLSAQIKTEPPHGDYRIINTTQALDEMLNRLSAARSFAFDTETTGLNPMISQLVGISLSPARGEAYYIPVGHTGLTLIEQLPLPQVIERLQPLMADTSLAKSAHNGKFDMVVLAECGVTVKNLTADTMVAAYLLGEKSLGLKALAFSKLNVEMTPINALIGSGARQISMSQIEIDKAADYACADADITGQLAELLGAELHRQGLWRLFSEVEMPLVPVLFQMERSGVALDKERLGEMSHRLGERLNQLEMEIYDSAGHQFNINSPQQLGSVLFEELQLPTGRKGKGKYSTEASVLEALRSVHSIVKLILDYRQLTKLKSTYIDTLPALINRRSNRVHTSFNQTRTSTGRLSSSEPNLQNIPVRGEMGRQVRQAFITPPGASLLTGDYSQIDLRVLAHLSQDPDLLDAFRRDEDIHTATAAQLLNIEAAQVTADMRRLAKTVNFGVIYGMSEYGLEQATKLSREDATQFITAYFEKYNAVKKYLESTKEQARQTGYVQTILGRRRFIPEINTTNRQVREAAERMAINMPVQGTSADIIKVAMINLYREMEKQRLQSRMLLQVHDELVFEIPEEELATMRRLVPKIMSTALKLSVPLKVDTKMGHNWGEMG